MINIIKGLLMNNHTARQNIHFHRESEVNHQNQLIFSRPHGLGGTDIAAVLGLSPFKTPLQLWAEKVGHSSFEQKDALHLRYGQHLEPFVAAEYELMTGLHTF